VRHALEMADELTGLGMTQRMKTLYRFPWKRFS